MPSMAAASAAAVSNESQNPRRGAVEWNEFERDLLRDGHHDLLQLGLGAETHQPDLAAGGLPRQVGGFEERVAGPGVEHGGEHHFIFQRGAGGACDGLQRLQGVGNHAPADYDLKRHELQYNRSPSSVSGSRCPTGRCRGRACRGGAVKVGPLRG